MFFVYQNHLYGNAYYTDDEQDYEDLYCETCGDRDILLDSFETEKEASEYVENYNEGED